ncbi:LysE family translocator [Cytobacillus purgationiresistens]|uniref:RhtB (Resistance to homoserine/threonine) family protein n=1 Tax=Cytobacillus purgationiresistens TaxID=863449 RepID=A0ABU0AKQ8_9BACI|nr:LysE family translocator [Cytobacillus purgationiresistens]MDQ0271856.1 RhtB (resistance to homoserine/threonine) family protein [Cytobacillus purgationiresistens]
MFGITSFWLFVLTSLLMNMTPGTDTMYIVSRSISQGKKAGIYSVLGISSGSLIHTFLAAMGLSLILTTSVALFTTVKLIGAAYLIYLGVRMLIQKKSNLEQMDTQFLSLKKIYLQGLITNVTNPKVALFYISFLPQFISLDNGYGPVPFILLGLTFVLTGTTWCLLVAVFSSLATKKLRNNPKVEYILNKVTGIIFIGLGVKLIQTKTP